ncbi:MAG: hypothetical protein OXU64_07570 [Gemmatimonadota bacterium]|nr:hypothetical protein [Gemmatimonadota bacterium]
MASNEGVNLEYAADKARIAARAVRLLGGGFDGALVLRAAGLEHHRQAKWLVGIARKVYDRTEPPE